MGKQSHLQVIHAGEVYEGRKEELLMRVRRQTETALERQVWESVKIDSLAAKDPKSCLNLKNK